MSLIFCAVLHVRVLFVCVLCVLFPACQCLYIVKSFPLRSGSDHIGGVMVGVFTSSAVDRGLEPRSDQTKDYKIDICCFFAIGFYLKDGTNGQLSTRLYDKRDDFNIAIIKDWEL